MANVMKEQTSLHFKLARALAQEFRVFPNVEAVAIGGSLTSQAADTSSDIDLYVYTTSVIPLAAREAIVHKLGASRADLNLQFWDLGDEWMDLQTGLEVDVIYWGTAWITEMIDRVVTHHQASVGYTTCHWKTVRDSQALYDRDAWFAQLQAKCRQPYPEALRRAIIAKNHPILRNVIPSYTTQIQKALERHDFVSINHRVAGLLASYFDVIFALNKVLHPGEKRLLGIATERCARLPSDMVAHIQAVLHAATGADADLIQTIATLMDNLDALLLEEGFDPQTSHPI